MKLEEQVTNLELSKKLKELGVKQESLFWWWDIDEELGVPHLENKAPSNDGDWVGVSAFTAGEIILPQDYQIWWNLNAWGPIHGEQYLPGFYAEKIWIYKGLRRNQEAEARAKMLIYLIENGLLNEPVAIQHSRMES